MVGICRHELCRGLQQWVRDLNRLYAREKALHELDFNREGFEWVDTHNWEESVLGYLRKGKNPEDPVLVAGNFTPIPRYNYRMGVPYPGNWNELLNSDASGYNGSGLGNFGRVEAAPIPFHGHPYSLSITLPPLGVVLFKREASSAESGG